jgi:phosphate transport system permease protein
MHVDKIKKEKSLDRKFRLSEFLAEYVIKAVSFTSFATIILIFLFVFRETLPIFLPKDKNEKKVEVGQSETYGDDENANAKRDIKENYSSFTTADESAGLSNIMGKEWQPVSEKPKFGLWPLVAGSLKVTLLAVLFGAPLAILAALFTALFAPKKIKEFLKPAIELLAGFPSVVVGFFALTTLATLFQNIFGYEYRLNAFVGGVAMALAVIPLVYTVAEDAITAVPNYFTEASFALGANKWQTALFVVLPAATPGIFAALLLGFGRAFGETMIVLMATGNAPTLSFNPFDSVRTLSATIGAEMAEVVNGDTHYTVLFLIGSILFIFTFILNAVAEFYVRKKLLKKFRGE